MIGKVDLRGLQPGGPGWEEAKTVVTASMEAHGAVLVSHSAFGPDLRQALFGRAAPEFFALPMDSKQRLVSGPLNGYLGPRPEAPAFESARVFERTLDGRVVRNSADVVWPDDGNPTFRDTVTRYAENMLDLKRMLVTMILESMGVRKEHVDTFLESPNYSVRPSC
ncbi:probable 2-oxoglutarate-dependent dioxygenase AOP1.2 [Panicum virgatum]|uniref:probable 2-oxoglutarate-dependent dioxygenase AOP1.2 n=1 Tax=Panicum virgatum TaxID=38727 RepID=UPI0019D5114C|nr:probable 2-oxoglutarate-dependent dioxygenase AOP1.2 [Panicum virgatum]